jgi:hypothetical protein
MTITSTGKLVLHSAGDYSIKFVIQGGDLQMNAGAVLNIERYAIRSSIRYFTLDLSGTNSITGAGAIGPITFRDSTPRDLTIQNVKNVSLASIDMHTENANTGPADFRFINVTASGAVYVSGTVDNSDRDSGGDGCGDITIRANTVDVNNIDARGFRNDPSGRDPYSGNVTLQALSPVGNYDPNDAVNNACTNKLTVRGAIRTLEVDPETIGGNVTLQSVVLQLVFGVIEIPPAGAKTLQVGKIQNGASASDLFVDVSSSGETVAYEIQWGGPWTPPAGSTPVFTTDPVIRANATALAAYAQTLVGTATDADSDPLTFGRYAITGPAWLQVAANGALSGTPALTDSCTNTWRIYVTDGTRFGTATLQIFVDAPPRWNDGNADFNYDNAIQGVAYANTLATNVIYCGGVALTFAKTAGPAWLNVASDGALSGTPDPTNVMENVFTVTVSDGGTPVAATLRIFVNGSPKFPISPFPKATAFVDQGDYAIRSQTLAGSAIDPQDQANPATLTWAKVGGPAWLNVAPDGSLSGTPTAGDIGVNQWTVSAANTYPATTATLRIIVAASSATAPIEVVSREFWDGRLNPHAADGVTLTGTGTAGDPATYTIPRNLLIYGSGQIYTSLNTPARSEEAGRAEYLGVPPLHIKFQIAGDLTLDTTNNAFVIAVHARDGTSGQRNFILDLNGTNSIVGQGRIVGLGNRVDSTTFPYCFDTDAPRLVTITNVNNVSLYDINVQVRNVNFNTRPLLIKANGKVTVTSGIDNSNRDTGGDSGQDITVQASQIDVTTVDTRASRNFSPPGNRISGNIRLNALTAPGYSTGGINALTNTITIRGGMRADAAANNPRHGTVSLEGVVVTLQTNAAILTTNTVTLNAGIIQGGLSAGDLFMNYSTVVNPPGYYVMTNPPNYVVNWIVPSLAISTGPGAGQATLTWTVAGYNLQTNSSVANPGGWGTVPGATSPAVLSAGSGQMFYRLKQ